MKLLPSLLLVYVFSLQLCLAQTTAIPDSLFEKALIAQGVDRNGLNGNIKNSDALLIKTLVVTNAGIRDLSGIEAFLNLETLRVDSNKLGTIVLDKNTKLKNLSAIQNNIDSIDLSKNTMLQDLNLSENAIRNIHLEALINLEILCLGNNLLDSVDLSRNRLLSSLELWNTFRGTNKNQITQLDLSKNDSLMRLLLLDNKLSNLDLSKNTKLRTLNCDENKLTNLNFTFNRDLQTISCSKNQISSMDVSGLKLIVLNCYNNQLKFLDLSASNGIVQLYAYDNQLDSIILPSAPFVWQFWLSNNNLKKLDISHMGIVQEFRCDNNQLLSLNIKNGSNAAMSQFSALNNPQLRCIEVDDTAYANANFSRSKDSLATYSSNCTSSLLKQISQVKLDVFPNPCQERIHFDFSELQLDKFSLATIRNMHGQVVHQFSNINRNARRTWEPQSLPANTYFLTVQTKVGLIHKAIIYSGH